MESLLFNVVWLAQDKKFYAMTDGCEFLQADLNRSYRIDDTLVKPTSGYLLFPEVADAEKHDYRGLSDNEIELANDELVRQFEQFEWTNKTLNDEQREAVLSIAFGKQKIPFLIAGPPGTGKTSVLCEAVLQVSPAPLTIDMIQILIAFSDRFCDCIRTLTFCFVEGAIHLLIRSQRV